MYYYSFYPFVQIPLSVFYLPVNWLQAMFLQKGICLAEMTASEKSAECRQRTGMRCFQNQVVWIVQHTLFHLCRSSPQKEYHGTVLFIQNTNRRIRKLLPADPSVRIGLVGPYSQNCIQKQNTLFCPFLQISVVGYITAAVFLKSL